MNLRLPSLKENNLYELILAYAQEIWPELDIQNDYTLGAQNLLFGATAVKSHPFIVINGIRYGTVHDHRAPDDCFAAAEFQGIRLPVRILYHFEVSVSLQTPVLCSIVQRFQGDDTIPPMPWDL